MARILYIGWNGWGHVNPSISFLNSLAKKNKVYYLNSPEFFGAFNKTDVITIKNKYMNLIYKFFSPKSFHINKLSEDEFIYDVTNFYENLNYLYTLLNEVKKYVVELKPNLIIHDSCAHIVKYLCKDLDIPRVSVSTLFAINRDMFFYDECIFEELYNFKLSTSVQNVIDRVDTLATNSEKKHDYFYDFFDGFLSKSQLNLIFTSKSFQPYGKLLDNSYKFIGNDLNYRRSIEKKIQIISGYKRKILISLGSCLSGNYDYINFYCEFINYFKTYDALFILVIGNLENKIKHNIPSNFMICKYVPQLYVLEQVDLFITHGGFNSISEAILSNTPMIVFPQIGDQYMNAKQVENNYIGKVIYDKTINFKKLEEMVTEIINNNKYKYNLLNIANSYIDTGENEYALELLNDYVKC